MSFRCDQTDHFNHFSPGAAIPDLNNHMGHTGGGYLVHFFWEGGRGFFLPGAGVGIAFFWGATSWALGLLPSPRSIPHSYGA